MYELRILNGLHRGATLPLDGRPHVVGASEDADVVLVDSGIETQHATLMLTDDGWLLSALDGKVLGADNNQSQASIGLRAGEFARIGQIWLTVVDQDSAWQNPPPEPTDTPFEIAAGETEEETDEAYALEAEDADAQMADGPLDDPEEMADAMQDEDSEVPDTTARGWRDWRKSRFVYAPLAMVTVLSACAAYAMTSKPEQPASHARLDIQSDLKLQPGANGIMQAALKAGQPKTAGLTPEQLRAAFRNRLDEVELLRRFELDLGDKEWSMKAALDDQEAARFGRVLAEFVKQHHITFPVHAKVGSAEAMLPFKIRQVISGANASLITQDGNRLYVGDTYRGMRLVAVNGNHLSFSGKRKIEVKW